MRSLVFLLLFTALSHLHAYCPIERSGWYFGGSGTWDWYTTSNTTLRHQIANGVVTDTSSFSGDCRPDNTWSAGGQIGYRSGNYRIELEGRYRNTKEEAPLAHTSSVVDGPDTYSVDSTSKCWGHVSEFLLMVNAYKDIRLFRYLDLYLGIGAGLGVFDITYLTTFNVTGGATGTDQTRVVEHERRFVYQGMAGLASDLGCHITIFAGWRIMGSTAPEDVSSLRTLNGTNALVSLSTDNIPLVQSVEAGIRINL